MLKPDAANVPNLIHGTKAIADYLGVPRSTASRWILEGKIPTFRQGRGDVIYGRPSELRKAYEKLKAASLLPDRCPPKRGRPPCDNREERAAASYARRLAVRQEQQEVESLRKAKERSSMAAAGLLYGVRAIAMHLGLTERQVGHLHEKGNLPTFKLGGKVCARRAGLAKHLATLEMETR